MRSSASHRVVVTGMGVVSPCGIGLEPFWDSLVNCKSAIGPITHFDTTAIPLKIAGQVKDFDLRDYFGNDFKPHRLARQTQFGMVACKMALEDAAVTRDMLSNSVPVSLVMGICSAGVDVTEEAMETIIKRGPRKVRPHIVGSCQPHAISAAVVQMMGVQTSVHTISSACPSGLDAVLEAARMIRDGRNDFIIVGAADSPLNLSTVASFCAAGIPSISNDFPPEKTSRPFDAKRSGAVLGEGAAFLILERLDTALARDAEIYMEILSGATVTDLPGEEGMEGLYHSMGGAMDNSGVRPEDVDYICANAVGAPHGDRAEVEWIKKRFGDIAYRIPISSIRGVMGHPLAPAGIFQMVACAQMIQHQQIVPTANLTYPDPYCDLDFVPLHARMAKIDIAMANGHGMGGENTSLLIERYT